GFVLLPIGIIMLSSLTDDSYMHFPPATIGLRWYRTALADATFVASIVYSAEIALVVAVLAGVLGVVSALTLMRHEFRGRALAVNLIMMPLALPHIVIAIALLQFFAAIAVPAAPYGLVAGHVLITVPFVLRLTMTSLADFNRQLEQASYVLGASSWQTMRLVTLPLIAPGMVAGVVFAFLLSFDEVTISIFLSLPGRTPLPAQLFEYASQGDDPVITAVSGLMVIFAALLVLVVERLFGVLRLMASEQPVPG
ncbi:MAG: ABC transporter permease, partial [Nevskiales bacterium]